MDNNIIKSNLCINFTNKILNIKFLEKVFDKNQFILNKNNLILTISNGLCKIKDYYVKTEDNKSFSFFLKLNFSSDGTQIIFLNGTLYNSFGKSYEIKNQKINLNKEELFFDGDSILKTDQGDIKIKNIIPHKYSINNQKIIEVNKGIDTSIKNLILFKAGCIEYNLPSQDLLLKKNQKIYYNNKYYETHEILYKFESEIELKLINYKNNYLYNFIIENTKYYEINNLNIMNLYQINSFYIDDYNKKLNKIKNILDNKINIGFKNIPLKINEFNIDIYKISNVTNNIKKLIDLNIS